MWTDRFYSYSPAGTTPGVSLSDLGRMFLIPPELQEPCGWAADKAVEDFMAARGMTQEPLIHSKATIGSGTYRKGHAPKPISGDQSDDVIRVGGWGDDKVPDGGEDLGPEPGEFRQRLGAELVAARRQRDVEDPVDATG